jgi:phosphoglucosamine mutase
VGQAPITPDFVMRLAHAVGRVLRQTEKHPVVLIGKDTRISGYMLESALESGFNSAGVDVVLLGPVPTPAVAYLTRAQRASLGVVISASHNPYEDNGIKFFSAKGAKLSDEWETKVEALVEEPPVWVASAELGKAKRLDDAAGRYIEFCKSTFSNDFTLKGMKIVVDAANGAAYQIAPKVFHELGADVVAIGCSPDGLKQHGADYGIALDGDADRLQVVDNTGRLYNGDELLYLMVSDRIARDEVVPGVVGTLMTNMAVEVALKRKGIEFIRSKVGDRYVLEALLEKSWLLGGEGSGHLLALDKHTTGDGLISALQVLQACVATGQTMSQLLAEVTLFPQVLINVRIAKDQNWKDSPQLAAAIQAVEAELADTGRVLIRASGTEPLVRVMVEAKDLDLAQRCAEKIAATLR